MYKKIAIIGGTAAVILGLGTAALAETTTTAGSPNPSATTVAASPASPSGSSAAKAKLGRLRHVLHGQVVTRGKGGTFVTHDIARGQVTAVSPASISIKAADNTTTVFAVSSSTKVRVRTNGKGTDATIAQVSVGDTAVVLGTGATSPGATHIVDVKK
jgi:hypothetical protein